MTRLILASKSAVRARLLSAAGVGFEAMDSGLDEPAAKKALGTLSPVEMAQALAEAKAIRASQQWPEALVIGADQTLDLDGRLFDKAETLTAARERLVMLRGREHVLHAALAGARDGRIVWRDRASATLAMRDFSDRYLDGYLARNQGAALASVGCYELEGEGVQLFEGVKGDYFTVLGLPLLNLLAFLRGEGAMQT